MALHIFVGHENVVGYRLVQIYMRTPPTHYHLQPPEADTHGRGGSGWIGLLVPMHGGNML